MYKLDELLEHLFRNGEVGNNTILHRANSLNVSGNASQHRFCLFSDGQNGFFAIGPTLLANCHNRGFIEDNTPLTHIN